MKTYLYLSLIPEALVASMLPPDEFGSYYAIGSAKRSRGQAIFFSVDRDQLSTDFFPLGDIDDRCVPHADGSPKTSIYLSIYRTLEHIPTSALLKLHLATEDGRVLTLSPQPYEATSDAQIHLFQEFCPVSPRIVSRLDPQEFTDFITNPAQPVNVPRIVFCDLTLGALHDDPSSRDIDDLPYPNLGHLRDCLRELIAGPVKPTKTVMRQMTQDVLFRTVEHGFYVGDAQSLVSFPMPSKDRLEREYYAWWRSALSTFGH
ncbi:MAG: hypothetical protein CVT64_06045 [Actinobacteria bacterium HGW-Actinobacteria-4]|nr:MAG: hypothetical protein CVT64_06045 [Actinobacteria bacterium HGW-Actinobacteria-4]